VPVPPVPLTPVPLWEPVVPLGLLGDVLEPPPPVAPEPPPVAPEPPPVAPEPPVPVVLGAPWPLVVTLEPELPVLGVGDGVLLTAGAALGVDA
jgi:hypothetical protein